MHNEEEEKIKKFLSDIIQIQKSSKKIEGKTEQIAKHGLGQ